MKSCRFYNNETIYVYYIFVVNYSFCVSNKTIYTSSFYYTYNYSNATDLRIFK